MAQSASISVTGMKCGGCENTIEKAVSALDGVVNVAASHAKKRVDVEFDDGKVDLDSIEDAIIAAGFDVD
ncbi:MAG: heavy-metal-associated domain-containing protein [Methylomonas sp.]|nr:heavy-metal-associated domain-containing protein [Methylomonas sp.]PPD20744.1 MAG: mercuric reductase [Methylomonas sp.]PPD26229.1 MAG: mercuric reductase [Methylomonas sp.]PPD37948.1 MAG: mercuric reductase [Methylomonas sp.]PPD54634.1 MAG: mercuric reductase [Methylomonas sp.]